MNFSAPIAGLAAILLSVGAMSPATADPAVTIASVQGTRAVSPLVGESVTVDGIVTADLRGSGALDRVYIQSQKPSGVHGASDAIAVVTNDATVDRGELVRVTGTVAESEGETRLEASNVSVLKDGVEAPDATVLTASTDPRSVEGMLVTGSNLLLTGFSAAGQPTVAITGGSDFTVGDGHATTSGTPYLPADSVNQPGDAFDFPQTGMILVIGPAGAELEPVVPVTASSPAGYLAAFRLTSNRLGQAPTLGSAP